MMKYNEKFITPHFEPCGHLSIMFFIASENTFTDEGFNHDLCRCKIGQFIPFLLLISCSILLFTSVFIC